MLHIENCILIMLLLENGCLFCELLMLTSLRHLKLKYQSMEMRGGEQC